MTPSGKPETVTEWKAINGHEVFECPRFHFKGKLDDCIDRQHMHRHSYREGNIRPEFAVCKGCPHFDRRLLGNELKGPGRAGILTTAGQEKCKEDYQRRRENFKRIKEQERAEKVSILTRV